MPTLMPSTIPSPSPTPIPITSVPTNSPSLMPSPSPSLSPSILPTPSPTKLPTTSLPSLSPSLMPSPSPSTTPSNLPTPSPTLSPTTTSSPSRQPSPLPSPLPSPKPTWSPSHTITCITANSTTYNIIDGTYIRLPELVGGKPAWARNDVEIFFSDKGIFQGTWVFHDKITDAHLTLVTQGSYKADEFPPLGQTSNWQLHSGGNIAPSNNFHDVVITPEITCKPTHVPTLAPSWTPTLSPTLSYLCVVITWDLSDSNYSSVPVDFYGSYYHND